MRERMLIGRPTERYKFLKQNYLLSTPVNKPNLEALKAQLRDIDADYRKSQGGARTKSGQGHRSETEANWGQTSNSGGDRGRNKNSRRGGSSSSGSGSRGGRGGDRASGGNRGSSSNSDSKGELICYCCGQRGHIKPECPKKGEECRRCGKIGHLQSMCKSSKGDGNASGGSSTPEASQFDTYDGFACSVTIGAAEAFIGESDASKRVDTWLGDSGASHHIKSSSSGMINVCNCPPGTTIRQVQGTIPVEQWGSVLLQVDGANGKNTIRLDETLNVPCISVNLFFIAEGARHGILANVRVMLSEGLNGESNHYRKRELHELIGTIE